MTASPERDQQQKPYRILVAVRDEHDIRGLLPAAAALASAHQGEIRLLHVQGLGASQLPLNVPDGYDDVAVEVAAAVLAGDDRFLDRVHAADR